MKKSLRNYTIQYITIIVLLVIAIWAALFYAYIMEEVYDNVDDGLKNQKIEIIREAYENETIFHTDTFGINQFKITKSQYIQKENEADKNFFSNDLIFMPYDEDTEPYRILNTHFYAKDGQLYDLEIRTSTVEEDELQSDLTTALVILYCCIIISIFFINRIVFSKAFGPFYRILNKLQTYQFGKHNHTEAIQSNVIEFDLLNSEIDKMISKNEKTFNQQKLFIENASHELQTPLAISSNKLELLMEDESLTENQLIQIAETKTTLERLIKLNKALLMLSRIENHQFVDSKIITFNDVIHNSITELSDILDYKNIELNLIEKEIFSINFNEDLAKILISNLIRNAINYNNKTEAYIEIVITEDHIQIKNKGEKKALNTESIFDRFNKDNKSIASNGLGLSIVKSILETNDQLNICYKYEEDLHIFSLTKK